ncbi:MAG: glycoside hydrolase family 30 beta sandwich domain-containing protein [Ginsengibacter sp.]
MLRKFRFPIFLIFLLSCSLNCSKTGSGNTAPNPPPPPVIPPVRPGPDADYWITKSDGSVLLQKQATLKFGDPNNGYDFIDVDSTQQYQTIDGFGYTLTGGSATLINHMGANEKASLLTELFSNGTNDIGVSYLRLSIGASDLDPVVFSYDDVPAGGTDINLANFSLAHDQVDLIPVLKSILQINPSIKIIATPWSAPVWMKDNGSSVAGSLLPQYYDVYAKYFVKYIQQMLVNGIAIEAITPQNEPLNPGNNPSMVLTSAQETNFIKNNLGPAFQAAGLTTKIVAYDHNCDHPDYPLNILNDPAANTFVFGSAFHLYAGDISALSTVHNAHPDKAVFFTEQFTSSTGSFDGDLKWHLKNVVIGSIRNWSRVVMEWNLANDPSYGPHTPGGCTECKGALTINGNAVSRNVAYYNIAQASKFVPAGSVRISSTGGGTLKHVAFKTPGGKKVLLVLNEGTSAPVNIRFYNKSIITSIPMGVSTYVW